MEIHPAWQSLKIDGLRGALLVVGRPDAGKSTFAHWLYAALARTGARVAFLDGDAGQGVLGPPTTVTLAVGAPGDGNFPPRLHHKRWFIGHVSPRGHMLPLVVGARRLADFAWERGVSALVYDSDGLIDARQGGLTLKHHLIDALRPGAVFAIQQDAELEELLLPLRLSGRTRIIDLPASPAANPRDMAERRANRARRMSEHFHAAEPLVIAWHRVGVFPHSRFVPHQIVALEDSAGFTLALGLVLAEDRAERAITVLTPLSSNRLPDVVAVRLGDLALHPETWETSSLY